MSTTMSPSPVSPTAPVAAPPPPPRVDVAGKQRLPHRYTMVLCALCTCLNYADRVNMSVAIIPLAEAHSLTLRQQSSVMSAFFAGYLPMQIGGALLCRRFGGKRTLGVGAALWSALTVITPMAASVGLPVLLICRVAMGLAEGVAFPAIFHFLSGWIPPAERATATALFLTGAHIGTVIALMVAPIIIEALSWPFVFYIFGSAGLLWIAAWNLFAVDRDRPDVDSSPGAMSSPSTTSATSTTGQGLLSMDSESDTPTSHSDGMSTEIPMPQSASAGNLSTSRSTTTTALLTPSELRLIRTILYDRRTLAVCLTQCIYGLVHYTILSWLPTYFKEVYQTKMSSLSFTAAPYIAMALCANMGGTLSDRLVSGNKSRVTRARKIVTCIACLAAAILLLVFSRAQTTTGGIMAISLALAFLSWNAGGFETSFMDLATPASAGMFKAVANTMASASGFVAAPLTTSLLELLNGDWRATFATLAVWLVVMTAVFCWGFSAEGGPIGSDTER